MDSENYPTDFKCGPLNLTPEQLEEAFKNAKTFVPSSSCESEPCKDSKSLNTFIPSGSYES